MAIVGRNNGRQGLRASFTNFVNLEAAGGIVLLVCSVGALVWANSPFAHTYFDLWETPLSVEIGGARLSESLVEWINDGLMALFFFVVGLEIKREILAGELASPKRAALPIAAAVGGMIVPALIFAVLNAGGPASAGWGVPMATDIAFALAALTVLGSRVPTALKVFLTALAIVDDLGAILVIAVFYAHGVAWGWLGLGFGVLGLSVVANRLGVRRPIVYALLGIVVWVAFLQSGVHATVAGVLLALTIPVRRRIHSQEFVDLGRELLGEFEEASAFRSALLVNAGQQEALKSLEDIVAHAETPLQRLEHILHPWVVFLVLPLFALANAGVTIEGNPLVVLTSLPALGIVLGLVVGKQVGIVLFAWIGVRTGLAEIPEGVTWRQIYGAAWLGGIGFTMSLFISRLAFDDPALLATAKIAILSASIIACVGGIAIMGSATRDR